MMLAGEGIGVNNGNAPKCTEERCSPARNSMRRSLTSRSLTSRLRKTQFQISIGSPPNQRQPCCPILPVDGLTRVHMLFRPQNPRLRRELVARHIPAHRAGSHLHERIVANSLHLTHRAARHHVKLVAVLPEPYWRSDFRSVPANRSQRDVLLTANGGWNWFCHVCHCSGSDLKSAMQAANPWAAIGAGSSAASRIDPALSSVLKALHA